VARDEEHRHNVPIPLTIVEWAVSDVARILMRDRMRTAWEAVRPQI